MEDKLIVEHNLLYSSGHQKEQTSEHYFPDHALGIMLSGESQYFSNQGSFIMKEGTVCLMRRNQLFKKLKKTGPNGEPSSLISILLDQDTLTRYATENNIQKQNVYRGEAMIDLTGNRFLKAFFDSLLPYVDHPNKFSSKIA